MAYFRLDEAKKSREELAVMAAGGDAREYNKKRKTLRELSTTSLNVVTALKEQVDGLTSKQFLEMAARIGVSVKREEVNG
jgi:hypothetical protein